MKKIFLLTLFSFFAAHLTYAQEITITRGGVDYTNGTIDAWFDISTYTGQYDAYSFHDFTVKNVGTSSKTIRMTKEHITILPNTTNYFCWQACYDTGVFVSTGNKTLLPDGEFDGMSFYYTPVGTPGMTIVKYKLQNVSVPSDSATLIVRFNGTPTSISELAKAPKLNAIFPNPANNNVTVNFAVNVGQASLEVKNVLGQVLRVTPIVAGSKSANINVADFASGIYFVSLKSNGNIIDTKRLVVN